MIEAVRPSIDGRTIARYAGPRVKPEMPIKPSQLREDIYRILDQVLETGIAVEIERDGKLLKIVPVEPRSKLENLKPRKYLLSDPEELVHLDWSGEWRP